MRLTRLIQLAVIFLFFTSGVGQAANLGGYNGCQIEGCVQDGSTFTCEYSVSTVLSSIGADYQIEIPKIPYACEILESIKIEVIAEVVAGAEVEADTCPTGDPVDLMYMTYFLEDLQIDLDLNSSQWPLLSVAGFDTVSYLVTSPEECDPDGGLTVSTAHSQTESQSFTSTNPYQDLSSWIGEGTLELDISSSNLNPLWMYETLIHLGDTTYTLDSDVHYTVKVEFSLTPLPPGDPVVNDRLLNRKSSRPQSWDET